MNGTIVIKTSSLAQRKIIGTILGSMGFTIYAEPSYVKDPKTFLNWFEKNQRYENVIARFDDKTIDLVINAEGYVGNSGKPILNYDTEALEILNILGGGRKNFEMDITPEYKATVTKEGVQVGCQLITFAKLAELNDLIKEFNKQ